MIRLVAVVDDGAAATTALARLADREPVIAGRGTVACAGLAWGGPPPDPEASALRHHNRMVRGLMDTCTVLPFRFWATAGDRGQMDRWLTEHSAPLGGRLSRVAGRVEVGVRASAGTPGPPPGSGSGRAWLHEVRRRRCAHPALAGLHSDLAGVSEDARVLSLDGSRLVAAYLVTRSRAAAFGRAAEQAAGRRAEIVRSSITGPWPPYSFADLPATLDAPGGREHV